MAVSLLLCALEWLAAATFVGAIAAGLFVDGLFLALALVALALAAWTRSVARLRHGTERVARFLAAGRRAAVRS